MQDAPKAVWSIPYVSLAFFQGLKQNFIAYRSSKASSHPDWIFEIHQLWQSGFSRVYSNCCYSCLFEHEIIKIGQSSHKMYSNNILNFQESTTILNACTKRSLETYWWHHVHIFFNQIHITNPAIYLNQIDFQHLNRYADIYLLLKFPLKCNSYICSSPEYYYCLWKCVSLFKSNSH